MDQILAFAVGVFAYWLIRRKLEWRMAAVVTLGIAISALVFVMVVR